MAFSFLKKSPPQVKWDKAPPEGIDAFKRFYDAETFEEVLSSFHEVCDAAKLDRGGRFKEFFPYLKAAYQVKTTKYFYLLLTGPALVTQLRLNSSFGVLCFQDNITQY